LLLYFHIVRFPLVSLGLDNQNRNIEDETLVNRLCCKESSHVEGPLLHLEAELLSPTTPVSRPIDQEPNEDLAHPLFWS
jgi:hypothetical protein